MQTAKGYSSSNILILSKVPKLRQKEALIIQGSEWCEESKKTGLKEKKKWTLHMQTQQSWSWSPKVCSENP